MGAPQGNKNNSKLTDPEIRQEAYKQWCSWIASGMPKESFFFDHPTTSLCYKTIENMAKDNPIEFPTMWMAKAKAKRFEHHFRKSLEIRDGKLRNGSPVIQLNIMRNMFSEYGWDRETQSESTKKAEFLEVSNKMLDKEPPSANTNGL